MLLNVCIQRAPNYAMQIHVPLRPKATFSQFNYLKSTLKRVAINFKLPNKAVLKTLQSSIKHRYNIFNQHLAQWYITKTAVLQHWPLIALSLSKKEQSKLQFLVNKSIFVTLRFHRWPRQSWTLPTFAVVFGNYHQFHHTNPLLSVLTQNITFDG